MITRAQRSKAQLMAFLRAPSLTLPKKPRQLIPLMTKSLKKSRRMTFLLDLTARISTNKSLKTTIIWHLTSSFHSTPDINHRRGTKFASTACRASNCQDSLGATFQKFTTKTKPKRKFQNWSENEHLSSRI